MKLPVINNIEELNKFLNLGDTPNKDFEVCRLEDIPIDAIGEVSAFRHHLYSVCLVTKLDMNLNVGYYKCKPKTPFIVFKSPYQTMSWQIQHGIKKGWHFLMSQDFLLKYKELNKKVSEFPFLQFTKAIPFEISEDEASKLSLIFESVLEEYHSNKIDQEEFINYYVNILYLYIRRFYNKEIEVDEELVTTSKFSDIALFNRFQEFLNHVPNDNDENPDFSYTVNYFAKYLTVHPNHLNAVTKRVTGNTAKAFIQEHIISVAKSLLIQTDLSIKEISYRLSFSEPSHFSSFFKKITGFTAVEYKKGIHL